MLLNCITMRARVCCSNVWLYTPHNILFTLCEIWFGPFEEPHVKFWPFTLKIFSHLLDKIKLFCKQSKIIKIKFRIIWSILKEFTASRNLDTYKNNVSSRKSPLGPTLAEKIRLVVFDGVPKIKAWFWIQSSLVLPKSFTLVPDKKVFFFRSYLILLEGKKMQMRCRAERCGRWAMGVIYLCWSKNASFWANLQLISFKERGQKKNGIMWEKFPSGGTLPPFPQFGKPLLSKKSWVLFSF